MIAAGVVLVRSRSVPQLLGGVLAGIVLDSSYALGTRLFPPGSAGSTRSSYDYRLSAPITYWNGLGLFATIGLLLALGFAARGRRLLTRGLAAATLPLLAATSYFKFSRGAWYALAVGLAAAVAVDPRRLQLIANALVLAPWTLLAIVQVRRESGLVVVDSTLMQATHDGHRLAPVLLALAAISAAAAVAAGLAERRLHVPRSVRVGFAIILVVLLAVGAAGGLRKEGSPEALAKRAWHSFQWGSVEGGDGNVGSRLTSLSSNGRIQLWRVSLRDFEHAPIWATGPGRSGRRGLATAPLRATTPRRTASTSA